MSRACPTRQVQCHGREMQQRKGKPWPPSHKELTGSTPDLLAHVLCVCGPLSTPRPQPHCCMFKPTPSFGLGLVQFLHLEARPQNPWPEVISSTAKLPLVLFFFLAL